MSQRVLPLSLESYDWDVLFSKLGESMIAKYTSLPSDEQIVGAVEMTPMNVFKLILSRSKYAKTQAELLRKLRNPPKISTMQDQDFAQLSNTHYFITALTYRMLREFRTLVKADKGVDDDVVFAKTFGKDVDVPGIESLPDEELKSAIIKEPSVEGESIIESAEINRPEETTKVKPGDVHLCDSNMFSNGSATISNPKVEETVEDIESFTQMVAYTPLSEVTDIVQKVDPTITIPAGTDTTSSLLQQNWLITTVAADQVVHAGSYDEVLDFIHFNRLGDAQLSFFTTNGKRNVRFETPEAAGAFTSALQKIWKTAKTVVARHPDLFDTILKSAAVGGENDTAPVYKLIESKLGKGYTVQNVLTDSPIAASNTPTQTNASIFPVYMAKAFTGLAQIAASQFAPVAASANRAKIANEMASDYRRSLGITPAAARTVYVMGQ